MASTSRDVRVSASLLPPSIVQAGVNGNIEAVCNILDAGGDIDSTFAVGPESGITLLMLSMRHVKLVEELVQRKASLDLQDTLGQTALMYAVVAFEPTTVRRECRHQDLHESFRWLHG